jgi:hypothetical protein
MRNVNQVVVRTLPLNALPVQASSANQQLTPCTVHDAHTHMYILLITQAYTEAALTGNHLQLCVDTRHTVLGNPSRCDTGYC